jgi:hypothetical protein
MVYDSQNYCVSELRPYSGILNTRKHNVSETGSVSFLKGETPTHLGPSERAHSKGRNKVHLKSETDPVSETLCLLII